MIYIVKYYYYVSNLKVEIERNCHCFMAAINKSEWNYQVKTKKKDDFMTKTISIAIMEAELFFHIF